MPEVTDMNRSENYVRHHIYSVCPVHIMTYKLKHCIQKKKKEKEKRKKRYNLRNMLIIFEDSLARPLRRS